MNIRFVLDLLFYLQRRGEKQRYITTSSGWILRSSHVWNDEVMDDRMFRENETVTIGNKGGTTFVVPEVGLPDDFTILRPGERGYVLTLSQNMSGTVCIGGTEKDVVAVAAGVDTFKATSVGPGDWGVIHLDADAGHTLFFQFVKNEPIASSSWRDSRLLLPALIFALLVHSILLFVAFALKSDENALVFPGRRDLVADYLVQKPEQLEEEEPKAGTEDGEEKAEPASTAGVEGKAGGEGDIERQRDPNPDKGEPDEPIPKSVQVGLLSEKSQKDIEKVLNRGGFDKKLGSMMARLQGPRNEGGPGGFGSGTGTGVGEGEGTGTLLRGGKGGAGGGGTAFGDVVTQKAIKTGGTRAAKGVAGGKGLAEATVSVKPGSPSGNLGGLTAAQINKVVRARSRAIRACYQRELQRSRGLGGKIVVKWKINSAGIVTTANVSKSTMRNAKVQDCIVRQVRAMKFPNPKGGATAVVNYPFVFSQN